MHIDTHIVYNTHTQHWRIILKKKEEEELLYSSHQSDGSTRQKQRALVLVFLSNFPVIHLPLNNEMIDSLSRSLGFLFLSSLFCSCVFFNRLLLCPYDPGYAAKESSRDWNGQLFLCFGNWIDLFWKTHSRPSSLQGRDTTVSWFIVDFTILL